jgi:hypothetical protein
MEQRPPESGTAQQRGVSCEYSCWLHRENKRVRCFRARRTSKTAFVWRE